MGDFDSIILVLITGTMTILASVLAQFVINQQKRNDFLKEKVWDQLLVLVESLSSLSIYLDDVMNPNNRFSKDVKEVDYSIIFDSFRVMKGAQSRIYMTGRNDLIKAFNELYETFQFIEHHYGEDSWRINVIERCQIITSQSITLIKKISRFMGS